MCLDGTSYTNPLHNGVCEVFREVLYVHDAARSGGTKGLHIVEELWG